MCGLSLRFKKKTSAIIQLSQQQLTNHWQDINNPMEFLSPSTPCKLAKNKLATSRNNYASHNTPVKSSATSLSSSSSSLIATNYQTPDRSISCSTSKKSKTRHLDSPLASDRFIPNRNKIDFDFCHHSLLFDVGKKENEDDNGNSKTATDLKTIHQNKFKEEVLQLTNKTPGKRMLPCFESSPVEEYSDVKVVIRLSFTSIITIITSSHFKHSAEGIHSKKNTKQIHKKHSKCSFKDSRCTWWDSFHSFTHSSFSFSSFSSSSFGWLSFVV